MKLEENNPWKNAASKYAVGSVITGKVARMTDFGAFVELEEGIDALLHVSQIAIEHVEKPSDVLKVGDEVTAKIVDFNEETKKISLSVKALEIEKQKAENASASEEAAEAPVAEEAEEVTEALTEEAAEEVEESINDATEAIEEAAGDAETVEGAIDDLAESGKLDELVEGITGALPEEAAEAEEEVPAAEAEEIAGAIGFRSGE